MLQLKYQRRYGSSKFLFILGLDDVINDVINTNVYKYSHNLMIYMYSK